MNSSIDIQLFGDFALTQDEQIMGGLDSPRLQALLAYLLLQAGELCAPDGAPVNQAVIHCRLYQLLLKRHRHRRHAVIHAQLHQDIADMVLDSGEADHQTLGDFGVV